MTQQTPTNPVPTAVPWTPDAVSPQTAAPMPVSAPAPAPVPVPVPGAAYAQPMAPAQPQYQPARQYQAPQPQAAQPIAQPHYAPQPPMQPQGQPQARAQQIAQAHMQPTGYAPAPQHQQPHHMQQPAAFQPQMAQQPHYAQPTQPYAQAGAQPLHMQQIHGAAQGGPAYDADEPKSFFAKLLKRTPKPADLGAALPAAAKSGSLFDKNFAFGGVAGLVFGAVVLPLLLGMFGGDKPAQTTISQAQAQAVPLPSVNPATAAAREGDTFIDNAIATDAP